MAETKRLWVVTYTAEIIAFASSASEAVEEAREAERSGDLDLDGHAVEMRYMPGSWDASSIPYGADGDATVGELIEAGAAPKYTAERKRLAEAVAAAKAAAKDGTP